VRNRSLASLLGVFAAVLVSHPPVSTSARPLPKLRIGPISNTLPNLRRAGAVGTLVALDPRSALTEFAVSCGRYVPSKSPVRPGRFRVDLRGATFGEAVNYNGRGSGHVVSISLTRWVALVTRGGWRGTLYLRTPNAPRAVFLTNGGATAVCAGVFG